MRHSHGEPLVVRPNAILLIASVAGCSPSQDTVAPPSVPSTEAAPANTATDAAPASAASRPSPYSWPTGLLSVLPDPFQRFDGSMVFRVLWPQLDNVRFRLAPNDPRVAIGYHMVVLPPSEAANRRRLAALVLSGMRPDSPRRDLRVVLAETQLVPPGPLELVAASAPKAVSVSSNAQFRLEQNGDDVILGIQQEGKERLYHFTVRGPYLMAQPPVKGLGSTP